MRRKLPVITAAAGTRKVANTMMANTTGGKKWEQKGVMKNKNNIEIKTEFNYHDLVSLTGAETIVYKRRC